MIKFFKVFGLICFFLINFQIFIFALENDARAHLCKREIATFQDFDKKEFPKMGEILFVGSSSIRGWRTLKIDFPAFYIINRGFGGSHLEDVNFYANQIIFPYKPKLIVLYAGENDIVAGKFVENVFADFMKFVASARKNLPKTRIIYVSAKPSPARQEFEGKFKELNDLIETETKKDKHLLFVDVWSRMIDANGKSKKGLFQADLLHINTEGYRIWRDALLPHIKRGSKRNFR